LKKIVGKDNPNEILTIKLEELEELYQLTEKDLSLERQIDIRKFMADVQNISLKGRFVAMDINKRNEYINMLNTYITYLENTCRI